MTLDKDDLMNSIMASLSRIDFINPKELPNIPLYMDQVTTFMDEQLSATKRYPEDKILTKTMINNYAKNRVLPAPDKKKYSKEHIVTMVFIYYFKNVLCINDIQSLLTPLIEKYFSNTDGLKMEDIYNVVFDMEHDAVESLKKDVEEKFEFSRKTFPELEGEEQEHLQMFMFIVLLNLDIYVKKLLIEKLTDIYDDSRNENPTRPKNDKHLK